MAAIELLLPLSWDFQREEETGLEEAHLRQPVHRRLILGPLSLCHLA